MFKVAERFPLATGVNVMLNVQLAPIATEVPQSLLWAKSPGSGPPMAIPVTDSGELPVFVRVTFSGGLVTSNGWLPNDRFEVEKLTTGAPASVAVPVRLTVCGPLLELSLTVKVPVRVPLTVGANVTLIVHVEPAATPILQLLASAKSPLAEMPAMCKGAVPLLKRVTVCGVLLVPTL